MNDRDIELVIAFVAGDLTGGEAAAFERRLAGDGDLAAVVLEQRRVIETLSAAAPAALTGAERLALRRAVAGGLGLDEAPAEIADVRRRRSLGSLLAVAAVAAVVVGGFVVVPSLFGGSGDSGDDVALLDTDRSAVEDAGGQESSGATGEMTTTVAAAEAPMVPMVDESYDLYRIADDPEIAASGSDGAMVAVDLAEIEGCLAALATELPGATDHTVVAVAEEEGGRVLLITFTTGDGSPGAAAVDAVTCSIVETTGDGSGEGSG